MLFDSEDALERDLEIRMNRDRKHVGLVSVDVPLISNLDVSANISLIIQYHRNLPEREAEELVMAHLKRFNLERIAKKRNPALSDRERFCVMLLRSAMVADAVIIIDRPLKILPDMEDPAFFYNTLTTIYDLFNDCQILDYRWNRHHYEMIYETE